MASSIGNRKGSVNFKTNPGNAGVRTFCWSATAFNHEIRPVADVSGRAGKTPPDADGQQAQGVRVQQFANILCAKRAEKRVEKTEIRWRVVKHAGQRARAPEKDPGRGVLTQPLARVLIKASRARASSSQKFRRTKQRLPESDES